MQLNNRFAIGFTVLLAACGGGGGHAATPQQQSNGSNDGAARGARYAPPPPSNRVEPSQQARPSEPLPADMPSGPGPRGTSGEQQRYDEVGFASWYGEEVGGGRTASGEPFNPDAITAAHNSLPLGSFVEVTALDSGRTIVVLVNDRGPGAGDRLIDLSRGAAQSLGLNGLAPVRVRLVNPPLPEQIALRQGRAASQRIDAPPTLLTALRRKLPARAAATPPQPVRGRPVPANRASANPLAANPVPVRGQRFALRRAHPMRHRARCASARRHRPNNRASGQWRRHAAGRASMSRSQPCRTPVGPRHWPRSLAGGSKWPDRSSACRSGRLQTTLWRNGRVTMWRDVVMEMRGS